MMKSFLITALAALLLMTGAPAAHAALEPGEPAPDFTATDVNGNTVKLSDYAGKTVVLEWTNHLCPFVIKHYDSGNMQALQKKYTDQGVIWLSINSSAAGKEGHTTPEEAKKVMSEWKTAETARLLDPTSEIGKLYSAKTTPHMFVIDENGTIAYAGAIDDNDSFKPETIQGATNYVAQALDALAANKPVEMAQTKPYGCSVKY